MEIDALVAPHSFDDVMSSMDGVSELASQVICKSQFCSCREQVLRTPNLSYPDHPSDKAAEEEQNRFYNLVLKSSEELLLMQKKALVKSNDFHRARKTLMQSNFSSSLIDKHYT